MKFTIERVVLLERFSSTLINNFCALKNGGWLFDVAIEKAPEEKIRNPVFNTLNQIFVISYELNVTFKSLKISLYYEFKA